MADQTQLDLSVTKDPAVQAILQSPDLMRLVPGDPQTYRLFGMMSGEGSNKDLIPAEKANFGHYLLDALTGGRYFSRERSLAREQQALDAAIIAHQLGFMQQQAGRTVPGSAFLQPAQPATLGAPPVQTLGLAPGALAGPQALGGPLTLSPRTGGFSPVLPQLVTNPPPSPFPEEAQPGLVPRMSQAVLPQPAMPPSMVSTLGETPIPQPLFETLNKMRFTPEQFSAITGLSNPAQRALAQEKLMTTEEFLKPEAKLSPALLEKRAELLSKQEEGKGTLSQLQNQQDRLLKQLDAAPNDARLLQKLQETKDAIVLHTTRADTSPYTNVTQDPLKPGGFVGIDKSTGKIVEIPSAVPGQRPTGTGGPMITGEPFLSTLPSSIANQVKALAEGRLQFPAGFALKSPYWQNMLTMVSQYDPSFDAINYGTRAATRKEFAATGKSGTALGAASTLMGHLGRLHDNLLALNNTGFTWWNWLKNIAGAPFSPELKGILNAVHLDQQAVIEEMERLWRGTGGNVTEIEGWRKSFSDADAPVAIKKGIKEAIGLAGTRIDTLADRYNAGMGTTKQGLELLSPIAQNEYQRLTGEQPLTNAVPLTIMSDKDYSALPKGETYRAPDGTIRTKR